MGYDLNDEMLTLGSEMKWLRGTATKLRKEVFDLIDAPPFFVC